MPTLALPTASSQEDPVREERLLRDLCSRRVDGLLVVPAGDDHSFLEPEVERGLPVVFLDRTGGGNEADTVLLDNRGDAEAAMKQLVAQGHRRVGMLDSTEVFTMREWLSGALEAFPGSVVRECVRDPATAARAVAELLDSPDPPTAFFGLNNRITVGIVRELCRRGSRAAVMGFDDFELSHLMPIPLTVIAYDTRELARAAAELPFARIGGQALPSPHGDPVHSPDPARPGLTPPPTLRGMCPIRTPGGSCTSSATSLISRTPPASPWRPWGRSAASSRASCATTA